MAGRGGFYNYRPWPPQNYRLMDITNLGSSRNTRELSRLEAAAVSPSDKFAYAYFSNVDDVLDLMMNNRKLDMAVKKAANSVKRSLKDIISRAETDREREVAKRVRVQKGMRGLYGPRIAYEVVLDDPKANFFNMKGGISWDEWNNGKDGGTILRSNWSNSWTEQAIRKSARML